MLKGLVFRKSRNNSVFSTYCGIQTHDRFASAMGNYDKIMRENLGRISKPLIGYLLPGKIKRAIPMPPRVRKTVIEKEADNLFLIEPVALNDFILHLEFQSTNDGQMPLRMAVYNYSARYMYGKDVVSVVIYVGEEELKMKNALSFDGSYFEFRLIDIRNMDPELFLESENPKEVILAVLAGRDSRKRELIINEIFNKLRLLLNSESALSERLEELEIISLLRGADTQKLVIKQKEIMPIVIDIRKDLRFQQGRNEGIAITTNEKNAAFVTYLLKNTSHTIEQIANLVNVSIEFVLEIQSRLRLN